MIPQVGPAAPRPEGAREAASRRDDGEPFRLPDEELRPEGADGRQGSEQRRGRAQELEGRQKGDEAAGGAERGSDPARRASKGSAASEARTASDTAAQRSAHELDGDAGGLDARAAWEGLRAREAFEARRARESQREFEQARDGGEGDEEALALAAGQQRQLQEAVALATMFGAAGRAGMTPVRADGAVEAPADDPILRGRGARGAATTTSARDARAESAQARQGAKAEQAGRAPGGEGALAGEAAEAEEGGEASRGAEGLADRLAQAARVEHALRLSHRPVTQVAQSLIGDLADAVRKALRAMAGGVAETIEVPTPDGAGFAAVLAARADAPATLVTARAEAAMPTPAQAAADLGFMLSEAPDGGMVVRLAGDAGQLEIHVRIEGKQVVVRVRADDPAAQQRLQEALPELKRALEKLPEVAAHGGHVDVRDESPGRRGGRGGDQGDQGARDDADDTMAETLEAALADAREKGR